MKKIITIVLSFLLCIGAVGGSFALFKHFGGETNVEKPVEDSTNDSSNNSTNDSTNDSSNNTNNDSNNDDNVVDADFEEK